MNISPKTLEILKNFASINQNINIANGNILKTQNGKDSSFFATAVLDEPFPKDFSVYDLSKLITAIELFDNADIEFGESSMVIKNTNGTGKIQYVYTHPSLVVAVDYSKTLKIPEPNISFLLSANTFKQLNKAASIFGVEDLIIDSTGTENQATISVASSGTIKKDTDNAFSVVVDCPEMFEPNIRISIQKSLLKLIQDDYLVTVHKVNEKISVCKFVGQNNEVEYIASALNV